MVVKDDAEELLRVCRAKERVDGCIERLFRKGSHGSTSGPIFSVSLSTVIVEFGGVNKHVPH